ncbi:MAG: hypothetical protein K2I76_03755 [Malacoplasma sp.]|nr:hypothetical protein [Malacoplasma sp.]MDE5841753.1 hypothetical protein [Malacoplasma sp.]MDE6082442.1 hypothetical protein [Malacoplasma sp.]MDE6429182.1 hypothetical protein [Malacoplasma sp.]
MYINKKFNKLFKSFLLLSPVVCIPIVSIACKTLSPRIHSIGSEWVVGEQENQSL